LLPSIVLLSSPAAATRRRLRQPSINISCPHGAQQQTRRTPLLLLIDETDRRTDRWTFDRFTDPAGSANKRLNILAMPLQHFL